MITYVFHYKAVNTCEEQMCTSKSLSYIPQISTMEPNETVVSHPSIIRVAFILLI